MITTLISLLPILFGTPTPAPDVLVIVMDDVGVTERSHLSSLDTLAAAGVEFTNFYAEPVCSEARYAALYGRYPRRIGLGNLTNAFTNTGDPPASHLDVSIAEVLHGSRSTALIGKWHLGRASVGAHVDLFSEVITSGPFVDGFDQWLAGTPSSINQGPGASGHFDWWRVDNEVATTNYATYSVAAQRDACLAWWAATPAPRFAWLAFSGPHAPFDTPPGMTAATATRDKYLLALDYVDSAIADVLAGIDLATTYVVVWGDNGTPDDARMTGTTSGQWKGSTYQGGINVPLVIAGPGISHGTSARLVSLVDIGPTLFDMLGLAHRGFDDGCSFADALGSFSGATPRAFAFAERYNVPASEASAPQPAGYDDIAIIEASWKLRVWDADGSGAGAPQEALYFLPSDPHELTALNPASYPIASARLHAELASLPARLP